jgi:nucleoside-diphosphate kinase
MESVQTTLVAIQPDGIQRGLTGQIISRFERRGLRIVGLKLVAVSRETARILYFEHSHKSHFNDLIDFLASAPWVVIVMQGVDAIGICRAMIGRSKPVAANPGSIRGDLCLDVGRNVMHASDSAEAAEREIALFFTGDGEVSTANS